MKKREKCVENNDTWKNTKESKLKRWKRKVKSNKQSSSKVARREYGKEARDVEPDMCQEELNKNMEKYMEKEINISNDKINSIEKETRDQSQCDIWKKERKKRLTSSHIGFVYKRNPKLKVKPLLKNMLYTKFKGTKYTKIGLQNESVTIQEYVDK